MSDDLRDAVRSRLDQIDAGRQRIREVIDYLTRAHPEALRDALDATRQPWEARVDGTHPEHEIAAQTIASRRTPECVLCGSRQGRKEWLWRSWGAREPFCADDCALAPLVQAQDEAYTAMLRGAR